MATTIPIPEMEQVSTDPEADTPALRDGEPEYTADDAEEEEYVEMWAGDRGNQAA